MPVDFLEQLRAAPMIKDEKAGSNSPLPGCQARAPSFSPMLQPNHLTSGSPAISSLGVHAHVQVPATSPARAGCREDERGLPCFPFVRRHLGRPIFFPMGCTARLHPSPGEDGRHFTQKNTFDPTAILGGTLGIIQRQLARRNRHPPP